MAECSRILSQARHVMVLVGRQAARGVCGELVPPVRRDSERQKWDAELGEARDKWGARAENFGAFPFQARQEPVELQTNWMPWRVFRAKPWAGSFGVQGSGRFHLGLLVSSACELSFCEATSRVFQHGNFMKRGANQRGNQQKKHRRASGYFGIALTHHSPKTLRDTVTRVVPC